MSWIWFWIIIYLVVIIIFTLKHVRSTDPDNYLINNRKTRTLPLVFTTLATFVGGGTSIGLMAMGYEAGFVAVGVGIAYVIGLLLISRFAGKIHAIGVAKNIYSFAGYLNQCYTDEDKTFAKLFSSIVTGINIFIFFFLVAAQFVGMASLLKFAFDLGYLEAAIVSCLVVIIYTALAGLSGVIVTDFIQFIVIIFMTILIFIPGIITDTNSLKSLQDLPPDFLNGTFYGIIFLIALPLFVTPSVLVRMDIWQRLLAAKSDKVARRVSIISAFGMIPFYLIFPLVGMSVKLFLAEATDPNHIPYLFLERHSSEVILGFAVVGLLAALMSSGDSFLNIISISAIKDFAGWRKKEITKKALHKSIRNATIIFGIAALFVALVFPRIVDLMVVAIGTITIFVPITFFALIHKTDVHVYKVPALWSIISGFVVNLIFFVYAVVFPEQYEIKSSFIPAFIVALATLVLGVQWVKIKSTKV